MAAVLRRRRRRDSRNTASLANAAPTLIDSNATFAPIHDQLAGIDRIATPPGRRKLIDKLLSIPAPYLGFSMPHHKKIAAVREIGFSVVKHR